MDSEINHKLNKRERATIVAALRDWQEAVNEDPHYPKMMENAQEMDFHMLSVDEIDDLCESLGNSAKPHEQAVKADLAELVESLRKSAATIEQSIKPPTPSAEQEALERARTLSKAVGAAMVPWLQRREEELLKLAQDGVLSYIGEQWWFTTWPVDKNSSDPILYPDIPF